MGGEAEGWHCSACRKELSVFKFLREGAGEMEPGLCRGTHGQGKRQRAPAEIQEVLFKHRKVFAERW